MNIFLNDPNEIRYPPEEVRLNTVQITPQVFAKRVKIYLELTPFLKRPNIMVTITTAMGKKVGHTSILETMLPKLEFTMHLRQIEPDSIYTVETSVYYQKIPQPNGTSTEVSLPEPMVVDQHKATFTFPQLET